MHSHTVPKAAAYYNTCLLFIICLIHLLFWSYSILEFYQCFDKAM